MQTLRKILAVSVIFVTVLSMSVVVAPQAKAAASAGDLIKMNGLSSIYYLGADNKRYVFPNEATYFSWYRDFSSVVTVPQSELESYGLGANVTIRPGTKLVKITTNPKVYAVTSGGTLVAVPDEATAKALYGDNWAKRVVDVADAFFTNYKISSETLTSSAYPAGSLIKTAESPDIYYIAADGSARKIASESAFAANRFSFNDVITSTLAVPTKGTDIVAADSSISDTSSGAGGTIPTGGSGLIVSLAGTTAPSATLITTQAQADLASYNFTASNDGAVKVTSLKIKRTGIGGDAKIDNLYLFDGVTRLTDAGSFSSGVASFNSAAGLFTVPAGQTKTITVKADMAAASGETYGAQIVAATDVTTGGAAVSGSFPVTGNLMSVAAVSSPAVSTVTLNSVSGTGSSVTAGTLQATLFTSTFAVTTKEVLMKYIRFNEVGSAPTDSFQNIKLFVNGNQAGSVGTIDANGNIAFDLSAAPVKLSTNNNTVELRGDVIKGSNRTYNFKIQTKADILLIDQNYNIAIAAANVPTLVTDTTISTGSVSVTADPAFSATQVVKGSTGVTLAKYNMKALGEDMRVQTLTVTPTIGSTTFAVGEGLSNITLYVNGSAVGSSKNYLATIANTLPTNPTFGTTNLFTIPAGTTVSLEIKADLTQNASSGMTSVKATLSGGASAYFGISSSQNVAGATYSGTPTLSIVTGALTLSTNPAYQSQNALANTPNKKIGSFILQAGSAEAVKVTNIAVGLATSTTALTNLNNLYISENTSPITSVQTNNNFPVSFTIAKNGSKTIDVYADLGASIVSGSSTVTAITVTANGVDTNNSVGGIVVGQTITVQAGSLANPTLVSNSPLSQLVVGGTSFVAANYKFVASNGNATINELKFNVTNASATSSVDTTAVESITVGGVTVAPVYDGTTNTASVSGLNIVVPAGTQGLVVPVTVKYNQVKSTGLGGSATRNDAKLDMTYLKYAVASTVTTVPVGQLSVPSNAMYLVAGIPTVSLKADATSEAPKQTTNTNANVGSVFNVMHFTVSASTGDINLKNVGFKNTVLANANVDLSAKTLNIYDVNDLNTALGSSVAIGTSSATGTYAFTNDYLIPAGQSREFVVKADTTGLSTAGNTFRLDLVGTDDNTITAATDWKWNDTTVSDYQGGYLVKNLTVTGNTYTR